MKPIAESGKANICLTCFYVEQFETRRCLTNIVFLLCCRVCH